MGHKIDLCIGFSLWIISLPILLPVLIILGLWRLIINLLVRVAYCREENSPVAVTGSDIFFLPPMDDEYMCMIAYVLKTDGYINVEKFREHFYNTFIADGKQKMVEKMIARL